jgi:hypothetical protein
MLKKYGRYYADWDDAHGNRRRKSFTTKKQALKHQQKMREESRAKKAPASGRSRKSAKPGARRTLAPRTNTCRAN